MIKWECKSSQVNLWWLATTPVKRRHKAVTSSALSLYIGLTFLRLYISYDSEIVHWKGVSKTPAFLLSLLLVYFWVWPFLSLPHLALAGLALLLSLWVLLYSKQHRFHPRPPCLILIPRHSSTCVLCSNNSQVFAIWKKLAMEFEQAQLVAS